MTVGTSAATAMESKFDCSLLDPAGTSSGVFFA